jgi:ribosomal protein L11 methyltransferase
MGWLQLEADLGHRPPEEIELLLEEAGAVSITLRDAGDDPLFEPAPGETPVWPTVILTALFPDEHTEAGIRGLVTEALQPAVLKFEHIGDEDWLANFEQKLRPQKFGRRLWIIPNHEEPVPDNAVTLLLSPGMAFGTGDHPTTAMCLTWLDSVDLVGTRALDYGCGSGILGLSAAALGAAQVTLTDIDPQALAATSNNAIANQYGGRVKIAKPEEIDCSIQHDVLVANILSGTLITLAPVLGRLVRPGAIMAITGILADQADKVSAAWSEWADMTIGAQSGPWVLLTGIRRNNPGETKAGN